MTLLLRFKVTPPFIQGCHLISQLSRRKIIVSERNYLDPLCVTNVYRFGNFSDAGLIWGDVSRGGVETSFL